MAEKTVHLSPIRQWIDPQAWEGGKSKLECVDKAIEKNWNSMVQAATWKPNEHDLVMGANPTTFGKVLGYVINYIAAAKDFSDVISLGALRTVYVAAETVSGWFKKADAAEVGAAKIK